MSVVAGTRTPLSDVWNRVSARLGARFSRVELLISILFDRNLTVDENAELVQATAALSDRLRRLSLYPAADLLRQIEQTATNTPASLALTEGLTGSTGVELASVLSDARSIVEAAGADLQVGATDASGRMNFMSLAVVGAAGEPLDELVWVATTQGCLVKLVDPEQLDDAIGVDAALILNDGDLSHIRHSVTEIHTVSPGCPVVAVVDQMTADGMAASANFVTTLLQQPIRPDDVMDEIRQVCYQSTRVETVGVFGSGADWLASELSARRMESTCFATGLEMVEALRNRRLRAVVLPPDPDGVASSQLLKMIRVDPRTRNAVIACAVKSPKERVLAISDGADVVHGPELNVDELVLELRTRLRRRSEVEPVAPADAFSHVVEWSQGVVLVQRMLVAAARRSTPVGVALFRCDTGTKTLDELADELCRQFRREDVVTVMDDRHLVVALNGVTRTVLLRRLNEIHSNNLEALASSETGDLRIAGLEFGPDGRTLSEMLGLAERSLDRATEEHGPLVVGSDWRPQSELPLHVMVLDPNPELGTLVSGALGQGGLRVEQHLSAQPLMDAIDGISGQPLPRVVLLDLDQRGLDGLEVLRRVRRAGALQQTKIIVTADRVRDAEIDRAFDLGATDAVMKPFSLPLLVRRVTSALEQN